MTKRSEKSFLVEASIISVSNFAVKIIGVLFSIPLSNLLDNGMGIFNAAYSVYAMLYMISTAGLPVATSRLVAAAAKRGRRYEAERIYKLCLYMFGIVGFVCASLMFIFAKDIAVWSEHENSVYAMRVIAPTLFTICIVSAIRGYLQGLRNMVPTAVSQFIEAFFKLTIGLGLAYWSHQRGDAPSVQAAYAISGITVGVLIGMIYLILYKRFSDPNAVALTDSGSESTRNITKMLLKIALPVTITSSALYLSHFADTLIIKKALISTGFTKDVADAMYSAYTTLSTKLADLLPSTFVFPIAVSILPAISGALAVNNLKEAKGYIHASLRLSGLISLPCGALMFVLARPCIAMLYGSGWGRMIVVDGNCTAPVDLAAKALSILAVGVVFISLLSTTNALLQAIGKPWYPMISVSAGAIVLILTDVLLVSNGSINIYGAPVGTVLCYITAYAFNVYFLKRNGIDGISPLRLFFKPFIAALCSGISAYGVCAAVSLFITGDGRFANMLRLGVSGVAGVLVYAAMLIIINGITEKEVRLLPFGNRLAGILLKLKLITPTEG